MAKGIEVMLDRTGKVKPTEQLRRRLWYSEYLVLFSRAFRIRCQLSLLQTIAGALQIIDRFLGQVLACRLVLHVTPLREDSVSIGKNRMRWATCKAQSMAG